MIKNILVASIKNNHKPSKYHIIQKEKKNRLIEHKLPRKYHSFSMYVIKIFIISTVFYSSNAPPNVLQKISHTPKYP